MPANPAYLMALPDQERSDAVVPDDRVSGSRPGARAIRLQGRRPDVGVLPEARRHRRRRPADRALRRPALGLPAVPPRQARRADRTTRFWPRPTRRSRACAGAACSSRRVTARSRRTWIRHSTGRCGGSTRTPSSASTPRFPRASRRRSRRAVPVATRSRDRDDYILHPPTGETLDERVARARDARCAAPQRGAVRRADCRRRRAQRATRSPTPGISRRTSTSFAAALRRRRLPAGAGASGRHERPRARRLPHRRDACSARSAPDGAGGDGPRHRRAAGERPPHVLVLRHQAAGARLGAARRRRSQSHESDQQHRRHRARSRAGRAADGGASQKLEVRRKKLEVEVSKFKF